MSQCNVICLAIDRLHVAYLGAQGNTWIRTPALDRLAAESLVFDRATIDSPDMAAQYRSLWLGLHALCPPSREAQRATLVELLNTFGYHSVLLTDEPIVADHPLASRFEERIVIGPETPQARAQIAPSIEETSAAEAAEMMAAPYFTAFYTTRAFLPAMLARGTGQIVVINSPASRAAWPGATGYTAARWALRGFTQALRADLHGTGLTVTSVIPGRVLSPYFDHNPGTLERGPRIARLIPNLTTEQAAAGVLWATAHNRREHVLPGMLRVFYALHTLAPGLMEGLLVRTGWQRPAQPATTRPTET
jgi:NAD(P)-dependent dehydrogenase (short-subunit alcohol dehydrogenase family)